MCLLFVSLSFFQVEVSGVSSVGQTTFGSMAGKGRKHHLPTEDTQEVASEGGVDGKTAMEVFMISQARRDEEMEERRERAAIAAEEREEARRAKARLLEAELAEKAKIAEEERAYQRKLNEAKRQEELELLKEARTLEEIKRREEVVLREAERQEELLRRSEELTKQAAVKAAQLQEEVTQKALEQQEQAALKAFEQQKELVALQAELGREAAVAQREESRKLRLKDRAESSVSAWSKSEDLEDFLLSSERKLRAGGIPEGEWLGVVASKLSGEVGAKWQELCLATDDYQEVKCAVLVGCGYTQKAAGEVYHRFGADNLRGLAADQLLSCRPAT